MSYSDSDDDLDELIRSRLASKAARESCGGKSSKIIHSSGWESVIDKKKGKREERKVRKQEENDRIKGLDEERRRMEAARQASSFFGALADDFDTPSVISKRGITHGKKGGKPAKITKKQRVGVIEEIKFDNHKNIPKGGNGGVKKSKSKKKTENIEIESEDDLIQLICSIINSSLSSSRTVAEIGSQIQLLTKNNYNKQYKALFGPLAEFIENHPQYFTINSSNQVSLSHEKKLSLDINAKAAAEARVTAEEVLKKKAERREEKLKLLKALEEEEAKYNENERKEDGEEGDDDDNNDGDENEKEEEEGEEGEENEEEENIPKTSTKKHPSSSLSPPSSKKSPSSSSSTIKSSSKFSVAMRSLLIIVILIICISFIASLLRGHQNPLLHAYATVIKLIKKFSKSSSAK